MKTYEIFTKNYSKIYQGPNIHSVITIHYHESDDEIEAVSLADRPDLLEKIQATQAKGGKQSGEEMTLSELRIQSITGTFLIGDSGIKEPPNWEFHAKRLEEMILAGEFSTPPVTPQDDVCDCIEDEICGICHKRKGFKVVDGKLIHPPVTPQDEPLGFIESSELLSNTPSTHSEDEEEIVHILKPKYLSKDGTIKDGFQVDNKWYAPKNDLTHSEVGETQREHELNQALSVLVFLKEWKDEHGKDDQYLAQQPLAWEEARRVLKPVTPTKPVVDWKQLREEYFEECTMEHSKGGLKRVNMAPHDLFEWFKRKLYTKPVEITEEEISDLMEEHYPYLNERVWLPYPERLKVIESRIDFKKGVRAILTKLNGER